MSTAEPIIRLTLIEPKLNIPDPGDDPLNIYDCFDCMDTPTTIYMVHGICDDNTEAELIEALCRDCLTPKLPE